MKATVVKVGGSLANYPAKLKALCHKLEEISRKYELVVVPGGGEFADLVRNVDTRFSLSSRVTHRMAILGMDQFGLLLSDFISKSATVNALKEVEYVLDDGKLPIFLPSNHLFNEEHLENSWEVTSDSIALFIAQQLDAKLVLLVTDVDGIYTSDPKVNTNAKLIANLSVTQLFAFDKRTSVDKNLAKMLIKSNVECFVVNGLFPERLEAILNGNETVCTRIKTV